MQKHLCKNIYERLMNELFEINSLHLWQKHFIIFTLAFGE